MGVLTLCLERPNPIIKEINLLESISNHVGTLIENALLFKEKSRLMKSLRQYRTGLYRWKRSLQLEN